jgi:hypothetical protein
MMKRLEGAVAFEILDRPGQVTVAAWLVRCVTGVSLGYLE